MTTTYYTTIDSPIGPLTLTAAPDGVLTGVHMHEQRHLPSMAGWERDDDVCPMAREQLQAYFAGAREDFDVPFRLIGTDFQKQVWEQLCAIPHGQTISYGELARRIGKPSAMRAVGLANGRNP